MEMGDLNEAQALQYLEKRGVAAKAAAQVVDVTGGRLLQLMSAVEVLQRGGTTEGAQCKIEQLRYLQPIVLSMCA